MSLQRYTSNIYSTQRQELFTPQLQRECERVAMDEQKIVTLHLELNEYSLLFICYRFSLYSFSILWQRMPLLFTLSAAVHVECGVDCNEAGHLLASALFQSNSFKFS